MADQPRLKIIEQNPIRNGLEGFRASYQSVCNSKRVSSTPDALDQLDLEGRMSTTSMPYALLTSMQISRISPLIFSQHYKPFELRVCSALVVVERICSATSCGSLLLSTLTTSISTASSLS